MQLQLQNVPFYDSSAASCPQLSLQDSRRVVPANQHSYVSGWFTTCSSSHFEKPPHAVASCLSTDFKGRPQRIIGAEDFTGPLHTVRSSLAKL